MNNDQTNTTKSYLAHKLVPSDVYEILKRYHANERFSWEYASKMARDIAAASPAGAIAPLSDVELRDKIARVIDTSCFRLGPDSYDTDQEGFKLTLGYGYQLVALEKADTILAMLATTPIDAPVQSMDGRPASYPYGSAHTAPQQHAGRFHEWSNGGVCQDCGCSFAGLTRVDPCPGSDTKPQMKTDGAALLPRLEAAIDKNVALNVASMTPEMRRRYREALDAHGAHPKE